MVPGKRVAIVHVETLEGQLFDKEVDYPKGEPENPMTQQEINEKFIRLCEYAGKSEDVANNIINTINHEIEKPARLQNLLV
jgi:2-methylcitrate dehydratase PrpD